MPHPGPVCPAARAQAAAQGSGVAGLGDRGGGLVGEPCPHVPTHAQAQELKHTITFLLDGNPPSS